MHALSLSHTHTHTVRVLFICDIEGVKTWIIQRINKTQQFVTVRCNITGIYSEQRFELIMVVIIFLVPNVSVFRPSDHVVEQYVTTLTLCYD